MTLFTGRGRHHFSSRGGGAWGQCCHVEQLRLQPSWASPFGPSPLLWASLCFVSPFVLQPWRKKERPFLIGDTLPEFTRELPWPLVSLHQFSSVAVRCRVEFTEHDERIVPLAVLPSSTSSTLTEQSNSEDVSFGTSGRAWQDVRVVICASPRARGQY